MSHEDVGLCSMKFIEWIMLQSFAFVGPLCFDVQLIYRELIHDNFLSFIQWDSLVHKLGIKNKVKSQWRTVLSICSLQVKRLPWHQFSVKFASETFTCLRMVWKIMTATKYQLNGCTNDNCLGITIYSTAINAWVFQWKTWRAKRKKWVRLLLIAVKEEWRGK